MNTFNAHMLCAALGLGLCSGAAWGQACQAEAGIVHKFVGVASLDRAIDTAEKASKPELLALIERSETTMAKYPANTANVDTIRAYLDACLAKVYLTSISTRERATAIPAELADDPKVRGRSARGG